MNIQQNSETGRLRKVIIHTPGPEVENMTPEHAERALYSDILNLSVVCREYTPFREVLGKTTDIIEVSDLLKDILDNQEVKKSLLTAICQNENIGELTDHLSSLPAKELTRLLIEGVPLAKDNLTRFLSNERFQLQPLHNFFFTRDTAVCINNTVLISRLCSQVRQRESLIIDAIFSHHPDLKTLTINPQNRIDFDPRVTIEGGDILLARKDILLIGCGARTSTHGVDFLLERFKELPGKRHLIVQVLPPSPESFIHLDMVFTILAQDACMIFAPVILNRHDYQTVHFAIDNGKVDKINEVRDLPTILNQLGMQLQSIHCGGKGDEWIQQREQWHSGANLFALAPGKVIAYSRNRYTIDELNRQGFKIITAAEFLENNQDLDNMTKTVITIEGSELARGGGGCRCMTLPVYRESS